MTDLGGNEDEKRCLETYNSGGVTVPNVATQNCQVLLDTNQTGFPQALAYQSALDHINVVSYLLICVLGLIGNGLVIYVVVMYAKMKTVTNLYILSLALSDVMFLPTLPITATTVIVKHWIFGYFLCKLHFVLNAVNIFGGAFNLCVMSADRYLAVCHPIMSLRYRTSRIALCLSFFVWLLSFLVMLPVILYTTTIKHHTFEGKYSCKIDWPDDQVIPPELAFVWYSVILGFIIPVLFISVCYILILCRLRRVRAAKKAKENRRSHGRVTRLIFTVVTVYVVCWLPYWGFQVDGSFNTRNVSPSRVMLINAVTVLSYANSMLNPLLYAFFSDNFRQSFTKAFSCIFSADIVHSLRKDTDIPPCSGQTNTRLGARAAIEEKMELSTMYPSSTGSQIQLENQINSKIHLDENGFLKPPAHV